MVPNKFRVAMLNQLRLDPYDHPHRTGHVWQERLIVERSQPDREHLQISDGTTTTDGTLAMTAFGRDGHTRGDVEGGVVSYEIPQPALSTDATANWQFTAEERLWVTAT